MSKYIKQEDIIKWIDNSITQCGNRYSTDMLNMMEMFRTVVNNCLPFVNVVPRELYELALKDVIRLSVEQKQWFPVAERLPQSGERVLAFSKTKGLGIDYVKDGGNWYLIKDITHWMPLPEPPGGD